MCSAGKEKAKRGVLMGGPPSELALLPDNGKKTDHEPQTKSGIRSRATAERVADAYTACGWQLGKGNKQGGLWRYMTEQHAGAATLAARTRAGLEVGRFQGKHTLLAFLDCSKCYDRVWHHLASGRAVGTGATNPHGQHDLWHVQATGTSRPTGQWRCHTEATMGWLRGVLLQSAS